MSKMVHLRKAGPGRTARHSRNPASGDLKGYWRRYGFRGDMPGGLGPTPKGARNPPPVFSPKPARVVRPWAKASHAGERERRLRQRSIVEINFTLRPRVT